MPATISRRREQQRERRPATTTTKPLPRIESAHAHHWKIDEAHGQLSTGVCVGCEARREFRNWIAETDFITATDYAVGTVTPLMAERE